MATDALAIAGAGLLVMGTAFAVLGVMNVLRLPDLYSRIHAANMVITGGAVPVFLALLFLAGPRSGSKALATAAFLLITTPLVTHVLARTAYRGGVDLGPAALRDGLGRRRTSSAESERPVDGTASRPADET